jgi:hypothetical protein
MPTLLCSSPAAHPVLGLTLPGTWPTLAWLYVIYFAAIPFQRFIFPSSAAGFRWCQKTRRRTALDAGISRSCQENITCYLWYGLYLPTGSVGTRR